MKKLYERPSVTIVGMEMEQAITTCTSYGTTGDVNDVGFDINQGNPLNPDGTDPRNPNTQSYNENWAKPNSVWE